MPDKPTTDDDSLVQTAWSIPRTSPVCSTDVHKHKESGTYIRKIKGNSLVHMNAQLSSSLSFVFFHLAWVYLAKGRESKRDNSASIDKSQNVKTFYALLLGHNMRHVGMRRQRPHKIHYILLRRAWHPWHTFTGFKCNGRLKKLSTL